MYAASLKLVLKALSPIESCLINLNSDAVIIKGNGSINNPYVIKTN